jgi:Fe-S cluster assembly iron-binding protein IscA
MSDSTLEVTPAAIERIRLFFEGRTIKPIRIYINDGFCVSSGLSLAVEEPEDGEVEFEIENYKFYIPPKVLETAAPIKVDFSATGFKIHSALDLYPKCPGCGNEGAWCSE